MTNTLDEAFEAIFDALYRDLSKAFPHPFDWLHLLDKPPWWQVQAQRDHRKVAMIFMTHGIILHPGASAKFRSTDPQRYDEDCGGSMVRRLRQTFQNQFGIPYAEKDE